MKIKDYTKIFIKFIFFTSFLLFAHKELKAQPWVENNAVWSYLYYNNHPDATYQYAQIKKTGNVLKYGKLCDELITKDFGYDPYIDTNYTYISQFRDTVFYLVDTVFFPLYIFNGDSLNNTYVVSPVDSVGYCTNATTIEIQNYGFVSYASVLYRKIQFNSYSSQSSYVIFGPSNERFGCEYNYLFPFPSQCSNLYQFKRDWRLICFQDDSLSVIFDNPCDSTIAGIYNLTKQVNISPNPFYNKINISGIDNFDRITIYDLYGKELKNFAKKEELDNYDFSYLDEGTYFMKIYIKEGEFETIKLIKRNYE